MDDKELLTLAARKLMSDQEIEKGMDVQALSHEAACAFAAGVHFAERHYGIGEIDMTDKELLELAAKAAGVQLEFRDGKFWNNFEWWDPLTFNGQAFRLAVKLKLSTRFWSNGDVVVGYDDDIYECMSDDAFEATRRAVVRAAAKIGRRIER